MALSKQEAVRLYIGASQSGPFYDIFTADEIQFFLDQTGGNILSAARIAASAALFQLAASPIKEIVDGEEIWNILATEYRKGLELFLKDSVGTLANGLMPYASGISWSGFDANNLNKDNKRSPLVTITPCEDLVGFYSA